MRRRIFTAKRKRGIQKGVEAEIKQKKRRKELE